MSQQEHTITKQTQVLIVLGIIVTLIITWMITSSIRYVASRPTSQLDCSDSTVYSHIRTQYGECLSQEEYYLKIQFECGYKLVSNEIEKEKYEKCMEELKK